MTIEPRCSVCGNENGAYPSDDLPPYITLFIVGHVVIPAFMWVDYKYEPSMWLQFAIWIPVMIVLTLVLLPIVKGAAIGLCYALGMRREALGGSDDDQAVAPAAIKVTESAGPASR